MSVRGETTLSLSLSLLFAFGDFNRSLATLLSGVLSLRVLLGKLTGLFHETYAQSSVHVHSSWCALTAKVPRHVVRE
jgi:hypothetical protein